MGVREEEVLALRPGPTVTSTALTPVKLDNTTGGEKFTPEVELNWVGPLQVPSWLSWEPCVAHGSQRVSVDFTCSLRVI